MNDPTVNNPANQIVTPNEAKPKKPRPPLTEKQLQVLKSAREKRAHLIREQRNDKVVKHKEYMDKRADAINTFKQQQAPPSTAPTPSTTAPTPSTTAPSTDLNLLRAEIQLLRGDFANLNKSNIPASQSELYKAEARIHKKKKKQKEKIIYYSEESSDDEDTSESDGVVEKLPSPRRKTAKPKAKAIAKVPEYRRNADMMSRPTLSGVPEPQNQTTQRSPFYGEDIF